MINNLPFLGKIIRLLMAPALVATSLFCHAQNGNDIIVPWTGTVDEGSLQVVGLPPNAKVIQFLSGTVVSESATIKVVNAGGGEVGRQESLVAGYRAVVTSKAGVPKTYSLSLGGAPVPEISVTDIRENVVDISDQVISIKGQSEYHVSAANNPLKGSLLFLGSEDIWLYFDNIRPSVFNTRYLEHIFINGAKCVPGVNMRLVQYLQGSVLVSQPSTYQPLEIFTGENLSGTSKKLSLYDYNRSAALGPFNDAASSFVLRKGYMATLAENDDGTGRSQVFIASDSDIVVTKMPVNVAGNISFIRVLPWRWVAKKGWTDGYELSDTLGCHWNYNWNNNKNSTLDQEYIPVRQTQYWPGVPYNNKDVTSLLTYNEPNSAEQANMTPAQAIAGWPELMGTGLRLGAPAITDGGYSWMSTFIDMADSAGYRVDFVGVHFYRGCNSAAQFYSFLKSIYDKCHRPIWVSEWNNGANWTTSSGCPQPTYEGQAARIAEFLHMLDTASIVERYSIYEWVETNRQMFYSTNPVVLNPAGVVYRDKLSDMANIPMKYTSSEAVQVTAATSVSGVDAPILRLDIQSNGTSSPLAALRFAFNTNGTTSPANISRAKVYYTGNSATFSTTRLVGTYSNPNGSFEIAATGNVMLGTGTNYFWLTYDVGCGMPASGVLDGEFTGFYSNMRYMHMPGVTAPASSVAIEGGSRFSTIADGDWSDPAVWACGQIPSGNSDAVEINSNVVVTAEAVAGNITISEKDTLKIAGGTLVMGASSAGTATGNSNRLLLARGTLAIESGTLNLNGEFNLAASGGFAMHGGVMNVDGNDGTAAGSITNEPFFFLRSSRIDATAGNINILDPAYSVNNGNPLSQRCFSYDNGSDAVFGKNCIVTFGGGDDQNLSTTDLNRNRGFYITTGAGTAGSLEVGTVVVAGGTDYTRWVTTNANANYVTKVRKLVISQGAVLVINNAAVIVLDTLVNNGEMVSTLTGNGQWLVMAGGTRYNSPVAGVVNLIPSDLPQYITGSGYFRHGAWSGSPSSQLGNYLSGLTVYHSSKSPGVTLNMPLTVSNLKLMGGKVNTRTASPLALGTGSFIPGNPAAFTPSPGTLYQYETTSQASGISPEFTDAYKGGWVNGPFSRYVLAGLSTSQTGFLPTGGDTACPAGIQFTTAPVTSGYLTAEWFGADPGNAGLPVNEAAVNPGTITNVAPGYWRLVKDAALTSGTYTATFTNTATKGVSDFSNLTLLKRADAAAGWIIQGTHLASKGSNNSVTLSRAGLSGFSEFAIGGGDNTLPVSLLYFKGQKVAEGNLLTWALATQATLSKIVLQRSNDSRTYQAIYTVSGTVDGSPLSSYNDALSGGQVWYYRLEMIDTEGSITYSPVIAITGDTKVFDVLGLYPNVIKDNGMLSITAQRAANVTTVISDMYGHLIQSRKQRLSSGTNLIRVDVSHFAAGAYNIRVYDDAGNRSAGSQLRFIVLH